MGVLRSLIIRSLLISVAVLLSTSLSWSQDAPPDSARVIVTSPNVDQQIEQDTIQKRENSPLDITLDRGLYIVADKGALQMHILGSIRFSAYYDNANLNSKNSFSTYDMPTGVDNIRIPNYYNSLNQTRIGFEITRKSGDDNIFIRLETDFAGNNNAYRIRHAYGQFQNFLIGQTWSLLTNVNSLPANVDPDGPVGSISGRTPQFRYTKRVSKKLVGSVALEYSLPDYTPLDSIDISFIQTLPNLTMRINREGKFGNFQVSGIIAPITGLDEDQNKNTSVGFGASISGAIRLQRDDRLLFQYTYGNAISHFMTPFSEKGQDMAYDPSTSTFKGLQSTGGFLSYNHNWVKNVESYFSLGVATINNRSTQDDKDFNYSYSISANGFWKIVDGLRVGLEYLYGQRVNIDETRGNGSRIWALFYYDF